MDRKQIANALLGYTTADILNTPVGRGAVLPFTIDDLLESAANYNSRFYVP